MAQLFEPRLVWRLASFFICQVVKIRLAFSNYILLCKMLAKFLLLVWPLFSLVVKLNKLVIKINFSAFYIFLYGRVQEKIWAKDYQIGVKQN
jgi:hypothetical protein